MIEPDTRARILITDDVPANIKVLAQTLRADYEISVATTGEEALAAVVVNHPDLILLDVMMPEMDGYEVCQKLKANEVTRDILVIFVTAKADDQDEARGFEMGAVDYITKPFSKAVVRARIKTHLAFKQAKEALKAKNARILKQNQELREVAQLRDDVDQIVRHDLKSPLNQIISIPDILLNTMELQTEQEQMLRAVEESGYRMLDMINRSHDIYKMERGTYELNPELVDILGVLKTIAYELRSQINYKKITLAFFYHGKPSTAEDSFTITGEKLLCYSMLSNLLKNAVEASPENECISIFLDKSAMSTIRINNKGSVPLEILDKFFDKCVTSNKLKGAGLGTYSAQLIVKTLGGDIQLDSSKGGETSVLIQLQ